MKLITPIIVSQALLLGLFLTGCGNGEKEAAKPVEKAEPTQVAAQTLTDDRTKIDLHPGKALHDSNCISCHDSAVYTRAERKVGDFPKLQAQVRRCDANLGSRFFDEEIEQVAEYLNVAYYRFGS